MRMLEQVGRDAMKARRKRSAYGMGARAEWRDVVRGYALLPHAVPVIVVMAATAAFAVIAAGGWPGSWPFARLLGAMLGGQLAIGAVNELVDIELDRVAKPHKPLASGVVPVRGARVMAAAGIMAMVPLSATFGGRSLVLCSLGTGLGIAYSLWFKRSMWSWLPYALALPLLPIWVWAALGDVPPGLWAVYPVGLPAVLAVQVAQSLPDIAGDRATGVRTLAVAVGEARARTLCWGTMALAAALAAALAPSLSERPGWAWIGAVAAIALVSVNVVVWRSDRQRGVLATFPCISVSTVALGVGWALALMG